MLMYIPILVFRSSSFYRGFRDHQTPKKTVRLTPKLETSWPRMRLPYYILNHKKPCTHQHYHPSLLRHIFLLQYAQITSNHRGKPASARPVGPVGPVGIGITGITIPAPSQHPADPSGSQRPEGVRKPLHSSICTFCKGFTPSKTTSDTYLNMYNFCTIMYSRIHI